MYHVNHVHGPIYQAVTNAQDFEWWKANMVDWIEATVPLTLAPGMILVLAIEGYEKLPESARESIIAVVKDLDHTGSKVIDRDEQGKPLNIELSLRVGDFVRLAGGQVAEG